MEKLARSVAEMAAEMGISRPKAYDLIRRSDFDAAFKCGSRTLISRARLAAWIEKQCEGGIHE